MMKPQQYHLAQANIVYMRAPLSDPLMAGFVDQLQTINELADNSSGFVWRLQDEATGNSTAVRAYPDEHILFNFSVWESVEALSNYAYRSQHAIVMRDGRRWFKKSDSPTLVLWWIQSGQLPTVNEAKERLEYLRQHGATPYAFSFKKTFPAPSH
jgi:hypothetical protein